MSGAWVTWSADVLLTPGVTDITPNLDRAVDALRRHRDIEGAEYRTPGLGTVTFRLLVPYGITEVVVKGYAEAALRDTLPWCDLGVHHREVGYPFVARLRLDWWPDDLQWWGW